MAVENVPHADIVEQLDCMTGTRAPFGDAASCRWYGKRALVLDPTLPPRLIVDRLKRKWRPVQKKTTLSLPAEVVSLEAAEIMGKCLRTELLDPNNETERSCKVHVIPFMWTVRINFPSCRYCCLKLSLWALRVPAQSFQKGYAEIGLTSTILFRCALCNLSLAIGPGDSPTSLDDRALINFVLTVSSANGSTSRSVV